MRRSAFVFATSALVASVAALPAARAQLQQPDGKTIPAGMGCNGGDTTGLAAELSCICTMPGICNQGVACPGGSPSCDPGTNGTCETTIWHEVNDDPCIPTHLSGLDPQNDAALVPETFTVQPCAQNFTLITRGTALFKNAFGWYNATGSKPDYADLHVMLDCNAQPGDVAPLSLQGDPDYLGGEVGFFLVTPESPANKGTCAGGDCCATVARAEQGEGFVYFSERSFNPDFSGADSWIHLLQYQSQVWSNKFYFAWEDSNKSPNNDFTDLLTSVDGIQCSGGGMPCDTGDAGVCGAGITVCKQAQLVCVPVFEAAGEACNGLDDDCDGAVDDDATCPPDQICWQGNCLPSCSKGEFPCEPGSSCDSASGRCVPDACVGKSCDGDQVCRADGTCGTPCAGVTCPQGEECVGDKCIDLCAGVSCASGEVCRKGKCFAGCASCEGITCASPLSCDAPSGDCIDATCPDGCPDGQLCSAGTCHDACDGVVCPPGQSCDAGHCCSGADCPQGTGGGGLGTGGSGASGAAGPGGGWGGLGEEPAAEDTSGCGCEVLGANGRGPSIAWLALGASLVVARRRRLARAHRR